MDKFTFDFSYHGHQYTAECMAFPIDGSTELHVTPLDTAIFEGFGICVLLMQSDGSIGEYQPVFPDRHDYIVSLAEGLSDYYSDQLRHSN